jgi:hypothetical protein
VQQVVSGQVCVGIVWFSVKELNGLSFKSHSLVSLSYIGMFVIDDANYYINNSDYCKLPLSPLSESRYQLGS